MSNIFLITNEFEMKAFINSLPEKPSFVDLKSNLNTIVQKNTENLFINVSYFFKVLDIKYQADFIDNDSHYLASNIADWFLKHIKKSLNLHFKNSISYAEQLKDIRKSIKISNKLVNNIIDNFLKYYLSEEFVSRNVNLYCLFFLKNISENYRVAEIEALICSFLFSHRIYFLPDLSITELEAEELALTMYDTFLKELNLPS